MKVNDLEESVLSVTKDGELVISQSGIGIKTSFGKTKNLRPYTSTVGDLQVISLYYANTPDSTNILKMVKSTESDARASFVNRSAIYAYSLIKNMSIDVIVMPQSSSAITKELVYKIAQRGNYAVYYNSFKKQPNIQNIEIDVDNPKITDKIIASLTSILKKAKSINKLSLTKILPQHRKFLKNLFTVVDEDLIIRLDAKNVLIVDDILTSGTTLTSIERIISAAGAANINALTIFK